VALSRPGVGIATLSIAVLLAIAGCAGPATQTDAGRTVSASPSPSPTETDHGENGETDPDGDEDPAQDRVRTGPVAQYGGPAYGDQGVAEVIGAGVWCKTIAVFWGGTVPEGVRFTFEHAVTDRGGLHVESGVCGSRGADRSCLGMTVGADDSQLTCSLVLRPDADFQDGTSILFEGTLECPTSEICDIVVARDVKPGPAIVVVNPEGEGEDEQQDQDQQDQDQQDQDQQDQDQQDQDQQDQDQQDQDQQDQDQDQDQQEEGSG
jgi:hypothetical protein